VAVDRLQSRTEQQHVILKLHDSLVLADCPALENDSC
jgi:hypothetical protein